MPSGYDHSVVIRWGDPVLPGAPEFDLHHQTAARQSQQFGYNNDFVAVLPLEQPDRALLVVNHEYTNEELMFPGFTSHDALSVEHVRTAIAAHGLSVVGIERVNGTGQWRVVRHGRRPYNRRITALSTPFTFTGPAAGSTWLRTAADPSGRTVIGTLNNCVGGVTPWGTVLSGEENFNQYFVGGDAVPAALKPRYARYGINTSTRYPPGTAGSGIGPTNASTSPSTPTKRTASAGSSRSIPTTRRHGPASTPRWAGSSTRAPRSRSRKTAVWWRTWETTNASITSTSSSPTRR